MEEMVEPDRTIMIVSIIGLVVIWGSVLYHKFVQGGAAAPEEGAGNPSLSSPASGDAAPETNRKKKR